jgi:hypothetical protein
VHAETGATELLVSNDGFRTGQRVCQHLDMSSWSSWDIGALIVTPAGSALVALRDGNSFSNVIYIVTLFSNVIYIVTFIWRIYEGTDFSEFVSGRLLHTVDMFETCSWVDPGRAHGAAGDVLLAPEDRPGSGFQRCMYPPHQLSSERPRTQADVVRLSLSLSLSPSRSLSRALSLSLSLSLILSRARALSLPLPLSPSLSRSLYLSLSRPLSPSLSLSRSLSLARLLSLSLTCTNVHIRR